MKRTVPMAILTCCVAIASGCGKSPCRPQSSDVWFATQYSAVYDLSEKALWLSMDRKCDTVIKLEKVFAAASNP